MEKGLWNPIWEHISDITIFGVNELLYELRCSSVDFGRLTTPMKFCSVGHLLDQIVFKPKPIDWL